MRYGLYGTKSAWHAMSEFEQFVRTTEPGLRRALAGHLAREVVA